MTRTRAWVVLCGLAGAVACSAAAGDGDQGPSGGSGNAGSGNAGSGNAGSGNAGAGNSGGNAGSGNSGGNAGSGASSGASGGNGNAGSGANGGSGGLNLDAGGGSGGFNPDAACESVSQEAEERFQPADIIWAIDTSGSMVDEAKAVQDNINRFSQQIVASGIDVHVVMLAGYAWFVLPGICVQPPLGLGVCPNGDSKPPNFLHVQNSLVDSVDALRILVARFNDYKFMFRPDSLKHLVVVTDDDSRSSPDGSSTGNPGAYDGNSAQFVSDYTALAPYLRKPDGTPAWKMNAIYAQSQCTNAARVGTVYKEVVNATGGIHGDLCSCPPGQPAACQATFQTIFDELAIKISQGAVPLACEWGIPAAPAGQTFDAGKVNVDFTDPGHGTKTTIFHVDNAGACDPVLGGWYYDNPASPTRVIACPASCDMVEAAPQGRVDIAFGCASVVIPK